MKHLLPLKTLWLGALGALSLLTPHTARAATITWSDPVTIAGDTDVSTAGTLLYAYDWNNSAQTVNGVPFAGTAVSSGNVGANLTLSAWSGTGTQVITSPSLGNADPAINLPTAYVNILDGQAYYFGTATVTLNSLTVGRQYQIQIWVDDSRSFGATRTETVAGGGSVSSTIVDCQDIKGALGQYIIGTFTADATTEALTFAPDTGGVVGINAIQLRTLPITATPTFSPGAGTYIGAQAVTITSEAGATIFYTTDGTTPTTSSPHGTSPLNNIITIPVSSSMTINAYATNSAEADSPIARATYTAVTAVAAGTWTSLAGGSWISATNWSNNLMAGGAGSTADFSTLTLTADATVTLDAPSWLVGNLVFGDVGANYNWELDTGSGGPLTLAGTTPSIAVTNQTTTISAVLAGTNGLTKAGNGTLTLTAQNTFIGGTTVNGGTLALGANGSTGTLRGALTINSGAQVDADTSWSLGYGGAGVGVSSLAINGGTLNFTGTAGGGGTEAANITMNAGTISGLSFDWYNGITNAPTLNTLASSMSSVISSGFNLRLGAGAVILTLNVAQGTTTDGVDLLISGPIVGVPGAGILKTGLGTMMLSGANTYPGTTTVSGGALEVDVAGSLAAGAVTVNTNGVLLANGVVNGNVVVAGGTLGGTGTIGGTVDIQNGGTLRDNVIINGPTRVDNGGVLAPGTTSLGTITIYNTLLLNSGSTTVMRISKTGGVLTSDLLTGLAGATYGGTLTVVNTTSDTSVLALGDKFTLFSGAAYAGAFSRLTLPALSAGLSWNLDGLTVDGSITVANQVTTPVFNPPAGGYAGAVSVTISSLTAGSTIHYTTDGSDPTTSGTAVSGPSPLNGIIAPADTNLTIRAYATASGMAASAEADATFVTYHTLTWINYAGGSWPDPNNWTNGFVAGGSGVTADFSTLTLPYPGLVTLDGPRTIGNMLFGDAGTNYTWELDAGSGGPLTLDATNSSTITVLNQTATIAVELAGTNGLTKAGSGTLTLLTAEPCTGPVIVNQGVLELSKTTLYGDSSDGLYASSGLTVNDGGQILVSKWNTLHGWGSTAGTVTINPGGSMTIADTMTAHIRAPLVLNGGTLASGTTNNSLYGSWEFDYDVMATNAVTSTMSASLMNWVGSRTFTISDLGGTLNVTGTFGPGSAASSGFSLIKAGPGTMVLGGTNTYTGTTSVSSGTLLVNGSIGAGPVTVSSGATLGGNGTINGPVTVQDGGTLAAGTGSVIGTLTIANTLTLNAGSATTARLDKVAAINDLVAGISRLTYGGTLTVTNLAGTLAAGDTFQLFNASTYAGDFTAMNLPGLGAGLAWNWTPSNGTLAVVTAATPPMLSGFGPLSGTSFPLTFSGPSGQTYKVLMSTNVALPLANWTALSTGTFGASPVNYTDTSATNEYRFYRIVTP